MATVTTEKTVNGTYNSQPNYHGQENGQAAGAQTSMPANEQNRAISAPTPSSTEIGWYFVEQYYNTMSKEPSKLYLYYTKKSQFVAGNEAEKVNVAVGQRKISDMIKDMDIQDCKVRVTNVDSQESAKGILVQVIGEMSNRAAPRRKFVQTFVLAEQPTGYYVLNDILRYILDEEEEDAEQEEKAPTVVQGEQTSRAEAKPTPPTLTGSNDPARQQEQVEKVDRKLEQDVLAAPDGPLPTTVAHSNVPDSGSLSEDQLANQDAKETSTPAPEEAAVAASTEDINQAEKPRDPDPTPSASPPKPARALPAEAALAPSKPAAPKTWANLVASKGANATAANPPKAAPSAAPPVQSNKSASANVADAAPSTPPSDDAKAQSNGANGWQTAGTDKQRQGRQHSQSVSSNQDKYLAYVKNVTEKVNAAHLKARLAEFGKLIYFDVNRQKNCAFVEFVDFPAYTASMAASPLNIGGEQVFVEERRPRNTTYGNNYNNRGNLRGGRGGVSERPSSQGRGGFNKDGGRGGYAPRGRGTSMPNRARGGQPQPA